MPIHRDFQPSKIKLEPTNDRLTSAAGLGTLIEIFDRSPLAKKFAECLPLRTSNRSSGSYSLGLQLISSLIYGHDCLDDLIEFDDDPKLSKLFREGVVAPRTMGDFLYDFTDDNLENLRDFLIFMAKHIRQDLILKLPKLFCPSESLRMNQDSTSHVQHGVKIEGVEFNYKGEWCLDTLESHDELGLCLDYQLRSGATFSSVDAEKQIARVFNDMKFQKEKFYSADSAFCNENVVSNLLSRGVKFTITAHDNMGWRGMIDEIDKWEGWVFSEEELKKFEAKKQLPPRIELGRYHYQPGWAPHLRLPVVIKRTWTENQGDLFGGHWEHYAILTNFDLFQGSYQSIVEFHNKRGHFCENFIREGKHNLDLKNFPCLKLKANFAYGLIAMVAHNLLRWVALVERPEKPHFAKKLRRKFIFIPGKLVTHARTTVLKVREAAYQEVMRLREAWQLQLCPAISTA